ncbi:MAG: hypothetical protein A2W28_06680 [Gammaproteobacteria bacterium RBG_16_51_14]|nr:MAG: hypothetical protein A2W28_06680 [Gammaproteobacteria bacterium RBG_16_51_14]
MKSWYLIHSKPRQERIAGENLERQGYAIYLPMAGFRRRHRGRSIHTIEPMFPRYLFIHLSDQADDWGPIRSTIGVSNLVHFGQIPALVPDALITNLRGREDEEGIQIIPAREFQEGDKVRIAEGPFEGYEAIFHSKTARDRVIVLLKIAENYARLKVDQTVIEPLS